MIKEDPRLRNYVNGCTPKQCEKEKTMFLLELFVLFILIFILVWCLK